jgi:hypothetical protein
VLPLDPVLEYQSGHRKKIAKRTCQKLQKPSRLSNPIRSALQRASGQRHRQLCQQPSEGFFNWLPFFLGPESALLLNQTASNCFNQNTIQRCIALTRAG